MVFEIVESRETRFAPICHAVRNGSGTSPVCRLTVHWLAVEACGRVQSSPIAGKQDGYTMLAVFEIKREIAFYSLENHSTNLVEVGVGFDPGGGEFRQVEF